MSFCKFICSKIVTADKRMILRLFVFSGMKELNAE
jgi:hypothetical protein